MVPYGKINLNPISMQYALPHRPLVSILVNACSGDRDWSLDKQLFQLKVDLHRFYYECK